MKPLPDTKDPIVLRTDFSDDQAWSRLCSLIASPIGRDGFLAYVSFVSDPDFAEVTAEKLAANRPEGYRHSFIVIADGTTFADPEQSLMVVDLLDEPGRTFRALPTRIQGIENNLSLGNMGFEDFAGDADARGVFRGFPGEREEDYEVNHNPPPRPVKKKPSPPQTLLGKALFSAYKLIRGKPGR
ncbi:DUF6924 domain-containing protein [Prosthecobacter sp.]|uniref:DUF6924 domain-containing protein n=1 Tax=Prosthecobacter sp. TaxID=1965333 RepID=UPI00378301EE